MSQSNPELLTTSGKRQKNLLQNIHRLIAIPVKGEVQGAEGAGVVELREIDLVGEASGTTADSSEL